MSYIYSLTQALLSDGTLAWRFYVVFNKEKWALYLPAVAVMMNTSEFSTCLLAWGLYTFHLSSALLVGRLPASRFLREQRSLREHSTSSDSGYHRSLGLVYIHQQHFDDRRHSV